MSNGGSFMQRVDIIDTYDPRLGDGRAAQKGTLFRYIPSVGDPVLLIKADDSDPLNWIEASGSGGGGGGANQALSNLTSPTSINQNLLFQAGKSVGAPGAAVSFGYFGAIVNSDDTVTLDSGNRRLMNAANEEIINFSGADPRLLGSSLAGATNGYVFTLTDQTTGAGQWMPSAGAPTGTPNSVAIFDNGGGLNSVAAFGYNTAIGGLAIGNDDTLVVVGAVGALARGSANTIGTINANAIGSEASGQSADANAANEISALGTGSKAHGRVADGSKIRAVGVGSVSHGTALSGATMIAAGVGAHLGGFSNGCQVEANQDGSFCHIYATGGGVQAAAGQGAVLFGYATAGSAFSSQGQGSFVYGAGAGGNIVAQNAGSSAGGYVEGGTINSTGFGSVARGYAESGGQVLTPGSAAFAIAHALDNAVVTSDGDGSIAAGRATGADSEILSDSDGSTAIGAANGGAKLISSGDGSHAHGRTDDAGSTIEALGDGSLAAGVSRNGGKIRATIDSSHAQGLADGADTEIIASAFGAMAHGYVNAAACAVRALGNGAHAHGFPVIAGRTIIANNDGAHASGVCIEQSVSASGLASFAHGDGVQVTADNGIVFGLGNINQTYAAMLIGRYGTLAGDAANWVPTDAAFAIGNGANLGAPAIGFRIDKDGRLNTTAAQRQAIRVLAASATLSARADKKVVLNAPGANEVLTLPAGEEGLTFDVGFAAANVAAWTVASTGGDTVDANVDLGAGNGQFSITFTAGTWYRV